MNPISRVPRWSMLEGNKALTKSKIKPHIPNNQMIPSMWLLSPLFSTNALTPLHQNGSPIGGESSNVYICQELGAESDDENIIPDSASAAPECSLAYHLRARPFAPRTVSLKALVPDLAALHVVILLVKENREGKKRKMAVERLPSNAKDGHVQTQTLPSPLASRVTEKRTAPAPETHSNHSQPGINQGNQCMQSTSRLT